MNAWIENDYHQPSDEITPAWDLSGAVEDARLLFRIGYAVAEPSETPAWVAGDEFADERAACAAGR